MITKDGWKFLQYFCLVSTAILIMVVFAWVSGRAISHDSNTGGCVAYENSIACGEGALDHYVR